jgi:hypothetical protein
MTLPFPIEILQGFVANEEIPNVARYLQAGRQFAGLTGFTLRQAWLDEWRTYNNCRHRAAQWTRCMDIEAELTLRGLAPPEDQVPSWFLERLSDPTYRNAKRPHIVWWVKLKIEDFLRKCARADRA